MLGVLTKGVLDDGRGLARQALFRHKHEQESGRTSSVSYEIMGFNSRGAVAHEVLGASHRLTWADICENSSKVSFLCVVVFFQGPHAGTPSRSCPSSTSPAMSATSRRPSLA